MGKRKTAILIIGGLVLLAAALGWLRYEQYYQATYITIGERVYRRDISALTPATMEELAAVEDLENLEILDVRGLSLTAEQYEALRAALPDCEILWNPPFQGAYYSEDTTRLTISSLTEQDIADLAYFLDLAEIDATACQDYAQLTALRQQRPDLQIQYNIELSGQAFSWDTSSIILENADPAELEEKLQYFPNLSILIVMTPDEGDTDGLLDLCAAYPEVEINWNFTLYGVELNSQDTQVDLSGIAIDDLDTVESITSRMPKLQKVIMSYCGIDNETMDALNRRYEDIQYVWTVQLGEHYELRTDEVEFMPAKAEITYMVHTEDAYNLRYCTEMIAIDLGHHAITNIDFVEYMPHLRFLIIADTQVSDLTPLENLKELVFLEMFLTRVTDYSPLLGCTGLEDLNVSFTTGDPEVFTQMTWLKRLWWCNTAENSLSYSQQKVLTEALPDCTFCFWQGSSTGYGWRTGELYYEMRDFFGVGYMSG